MTSTLLYDIFSSVTRPHANVLLSGSGDTNGTSPLNFLYYSPSADPYYITNLDQPLDPFIESALEDTYFANVVHIVLESMRADCYPYKEGGLLDQRIKREFEPMSAINTATITPFIDSLSTHIIQWDTMQTTIAYTLKSMLGCTHPLC